MITKSNQREASLSILQRLRQQGLPAREEKMDSMFDGMLAKSEGEESEEKSQSPEYEMESPEEQARKREKKKNPNLNPKGVEHMKNIFRKQT